MKNCRRSTDIQVALDSRLFRQCLMVLLLLLFQHLQYILQERNVFILIDLTRKIVLIGGTQYAGEMKKSMFGVMNFLLPEKGVFPMHCSANIGKNGDTALFLLSPHHYTAS